MHSDHVVPRLHGSGGRDGGVDSTAHRRKDPHATSLRACGCAGAGCARVGLRDHAEHRVDVGVRRRAPEGETQDAPRVALAVPHRDDDMRGLGDAGLTRGTRRCGHPGDIEEEQEALAHSPGEQQVCVAGETPDGISEELGGRYSRTDPADETVAQQAQSGSLVLAFVLGELEGDGERGGSGYVLRTRAETALLRAATKHRRDAGGAGGDERSDADRGADLVSGETHRDESDAASGLAAQGAERQRHVPERGDGIEMEESTLYPLLRRLESQGLLQSEWREEEKRKKRFYHLSPMGEAMLAALTDEWRGISASLDKIL